MQLTTYRFRLKDSSCRNRLRKLGYGVNAGWNYANERTAYQWSFRRQLLSAFDLHKLTAGVDLGLHTLATLSDGVACHRQNLTRTFELRLARAQRARKKKQVTRIHARIKNKRKDWNHKQTTLLTRAYDVLVVGNVSSAKLKKTNLAKSVSDAGWADFKQMRKCCSRITYKAVRLGITYLEVNESFSIRHLLGLFRQEWPEWTKGVRSKNVEL